MKDAELSRRIRPGGALPPGFAALALPVNVATRAQAGELVRLADGTELPFLVPSASGRFPLPPGGVLRIAAARLVLETSAGPIAMRHETTPVYVMLDDEYNISFTVRFRDPE